MQTLIAFLLVLIASVFILLRWLPKAWSIKLFGLGKISQILRKASSSSCSDHCKGCAADGACDTSDSRQEHVVRLHTKPKSMI